MKCGLVPVAAGWGPLPRPGQGWCRRAGLAVQLVSAAQAKNLPGRPKTDLDAMWLARLTEMGLLHASFVPPRAIRDLRDYTRAWTRLVHERIPYAVAQWRREHPGEQIPDGHVFTQPWPTGPDGGHRNQLIYYQYKADRARRILRGIDEQVAKAQQAVAGNSPVKRNRFIQLSGGTRSVNRELDEKARALAGLKGYVTNLAACPDGTPVTAEFVIGAYHQLFQIETSKPQCCHICGSSDSSRVPSSSELLPAC